jgi:hypothetical protein
MTKLRVAVSEPMRVAESVTANRKATIVALSFKVYGDPLLVDEV